MPIMVTSALFLSPLHYHFSPLASGRWACLLGGGIGMLRPDQNIRLNSERPPRGGLSFSAHTFEFRPKNFLSVGGMAVNIEAMLLIESLSRTLKNWRCRTIKTASEVSHEIAVRRPFCLACR